MDMRDKLTGALIGLARATDGNAHLISPASTAIILEGLSATRENAVADTGTLEALLERVDTEKRQMVPNCFECAAPCGRTDAYDLTRLQNEDEEARLLKERILAKIRELAAEAHRETVHGTDRERLFYQALVVVGLEGLDPKLLLGTLREIEKN